MTHLDVANLNDLFQKDVKGYTPVLLDLYNPVISWTSEEQSVYGQENGHVRFIADEVKVKYKNNTYLPCAFEFTPPETDGTKIGNATISISALDTRVRKIIRTLKLPSTIKIVAMFAKEQKQTDSETGAVSYIYKFAEINFSEFYVTGATSNKSVATFTLQFDGALSQNVPFDVATMDRVRCVDNA